MSERDDIEREIIQAHELMSFSASELRSANTAIQRHYHWSGFLKHWRIFIQRLLIFAKHHPEARGWHHRAKNRIHRDPVLNYLWECRNAEEHAFETKDEPDFTKEEPFQNVAARVEVPRFPPIFRGTYAVFNNCAVNGENFTMAVDWREKDPRVFLDGSVSVELSGDEIRLKDVKTVKGKIVPVPKPANEGARPVYLDFVAHAYGAADQMLLEYRGILGNGASTAAK